MRCKLGSISIYVDSAANFTIDAEYIDPLLIQKALPKDQLQEGSGYVIAALVREFKDVIEDYNDKAKELIKRM